jgi:hypothetical protein
MRCAAFSTALNYKLSFEAHSTLIDYWDEYE